MQQIRLPSLLHSTPAMSSIIDFMATLSIFLNVLFFDFIGYIHTLFLRKIEAISHQDVLIYLIYMNYPFQSKKKRKRFCGFCRLDYQQYLVLAGRIS